MPKPYAPARPRPGLMFRPICLLRLTLGLCLMLLFAAPAKAAEGLVWPASPEIWKNLISRLESDGYSRTRMQALFNRPEVTFMPEVIKAKTLDTFKGKFYPSKKSPDKQAKPKMYSFMLTAERLAEVKAFFQDNLNLLQKVETAYGVPKEILAAIIAVETRQGQNLGQQYAFSALASLALAMDMDMVLPFFKGIKITPEQMVWLEKRAFSRADWAYKEFKALLAYTQSIGLDPVTVPGSKFGAIGICQFMPSSAMRLAVDGNGDGRIDLFNLDDATHSIANFLKAHSWKSELTPDKNRKALMGYNPSTIYVNTVLFVADTLAQ